MFCNEVGSNPTVSNFLFSKTGGRDATLTPRKEGDNDKMEKEFDSKTITEIEELIDLRKGDFDNEGCEVLCKEHFLFPMLRELRQKEK